MDTGKEKQLRERLEDVFYDAFIEDREADQNAHPMTLGDRCKKYAAIVATILSQPEGPTSNREDFAENAERNQKENVAHGGIERADAAPKPQPEPPHKLIHEYTSLGCVACDLTNTKHIDGQEVDDPRPSTLGPKRCPFCQQEIARAQSGELQARLDEANWWYHKYTWPVEGQVASEVEGIDRIAELENQLVKSKETK